MFENKCPTVVSVPIFRPDLIPNENLFTSKLIQVHHEVNPPFWSKSGLPRQANQTWSRGNCANNSKHLFQSDCGITDSHKSIQGSGDRWREKSVSEHGATSPGGAVMGMKRSSKTQILLGENKRTD